MSISSTGRIWDLPTRIFHWSLAGCFVGLLVTGKIGGDAVVAWHARIGYCAATLVLFRLVWGFAGGHWSRFAVFPPSPLRAWRYLRGEFPEPIGHNPLGAFSVYAMLAFLLLQVASGLFSATKEDFAGPLNSLVSNGTAHLLTGYHKNIGQWVLIALVAMHLCSVFYHTLRGRKLIGSMLHGDGAFTTGSPASLDDARARFRAFIVLMLCGCLVWGLVGLGN